MQRANGEMLKVLFIIGSIVCFSNAAYHYDYNDNTPKAFAHRYNDDEDTPDFEPIVPMTKDRDKLVIASLKNIVCEEFDRYTLNCTLNAAMIYNSSRKSPPMPDKLKYWCRAIRHLTNCAMDWNSDCRAVTDNHFNEESIKGHIHVLENACDDDWFLSRYDTLSNCISSVGEAWEKCYMEFKMQVDAQKNTSREWTHYETHFYICCARTQFRRCSLHSLFSAPNDCNHDQAVVLQKFSSIVSEGDVFQDCELNMNYPNCPGGDPRPSKLMLTRLLGVELEHNLIPLDDPTTSGCDHQMKLWPTVITFVLLIQSKMYFGFFLYRNSTQSCVAKGTFIFQQTHKLLIQLLYHLKVV